MPEIIFWVDALYSCLSTPILNRTEYPSGANQSLGLMQATRADFVIQ